MRSCFCGEALQPLWILPNSVMFPCRQVMLLGEACAPSTSSAQLRWVVQIC